MKILYIGSANTDACATFYADAATGLGHMVHRYDPKLFETNGFLGKALTRLHKGPLKRKINQATAEIGSLIRNGGYDIVLNIAENFISPEVFEAARKASRSPKFIYHSHDNNFSDGILKPNHFFTTLTLYDFVYTTKSQNVKRYQDLGQPNAFYIPSAYEPRVHRPLSGKESQLKEKKFDVTFVGTYDYSRDKYMNAVGWERLYVWGNRWPRFQDFKKRIAHITPHAIYYPDFADVLSHSKITLGLLREEAEDLHTQRTFEIPACGTLQIAPRNSEILQYFEEDKEIVCFSSVEELKDKVEFYLMNDSARSQISRAGFERVKKDGHTYTDRVRTMLAEAAPQP